MTKFDGIINPNEHLEPVFIVCGKTDEENIKTIPQEKVIEGLSEYKIKQDFEGAIKILDYWMNEAIFGQDRKGELLCSNEMMEMYRKLGNKEKAVDSAVNALHLVQLLEMEDTITSGTIYFNAASVYASFGQLELSVNLFEKAEAIFKENLIAYDSRMGAVYNNLGYVKSSLGRYGEAYEYFNRALEAMEDSDYEKIDSAITYLNMAGAVEDEHGLEKGDQKIGQYLEKAEELFFDEDIKETIYSSSACRKCAPVFEYYGYFITAAKLKVLADKIYNKAVETLL